MVSDSCLDMIPKMKDHRSWIRNRGRSCDIFSIFFKDISFTSQQAGVWDKLKDCRRWFKALWLDHDMRRLHISLTSAEALRKIWARQKWAQWFISSNPFVLQGCLSTWVEWKIVCESRMKSRQCISAATHFFHWSLILPSPVLLHLRYYTLICEGAA